MARYGVVVVRYGYIEVDADSSVEAMRYVDKNAKTDDVSWSDDWDATDAEEVEE